MRQARFEFLAAWGRQKSLYAPKFACVESFDFHFAFGQDAQTNGLYSARGFGTWQFAPQNGRKVKAHQVIECAAGKVCLNQWHIDLTRVLHRLCYSRLCNSIKNNTADGCVFINSFALG